MAQDRARRELQARQAAEAAAEAVEQAQATGAEPDELVELGIRLEQSSIVHAHEAEALAATTAAHSKAKGALSTARALAHKARQALAGAERAVASPPTVRLPEDAWADTMSQLADDFRRAGLGLGG